MNIKVKRIRDVELPTRGTPKSAGLDFYVPNDFEAVYLYPGNSILIPSGLQVEFPEDHAFIAFNKSGIAVKYNLIIGACVIDEDYQGELGLHVINAGKEMPVLIKGGMKLTQFLLIPVAYPKVIETEDIHEIKTQRGDGGYGSTGEHYTQ